MLLIVQCQCETIEEMWLKWFYKRPMTLGHMLMYSDASLDLSPTTGITGCLAETSPHAF